MGPRKQHKTTAGSGYTITGGILFVIGILCIIYAVNILKFFFQIRDTVDTAGENAEGTEALGQALGAILLFSSVGIQSLALGIGVGICGIILIIVGTTLWSVGAHKYYTR
jgi:hypothetical protein